LQAIISPSRQHYIPQKEICIDEAMIRFNGRHKDVVYMPHKPIKYGLKIFIAAESSSGYVLSYEPYTSNKSENSEKYHNS
jgi:hypothetical protein